MLYKSGYQHIQSRSSWNLRKAYTYEEHQAHTLASI